MDCNQTWCSSYCLRLNLQNNQHACSRRRVAISIIARGWRHRNINHRHHITNRTHPAANMLGDIDLRQLPHTLTITTLNTRGSLKDAHKWHIIQEIILQKQPDIVILTETNGHNPKHSPPTHQDTDLNTSETRQHMVQRTYQFPYLFHSTDHHEKGTRGGILTLIHRKWQHRIIGKPTIPPHKRWIIHTIRTQNAKIAIIGLYGRPGPEKSHQAQQEWNEMLDTINRLHSTNHTVVIGGDYNTTRNIPSNRSHPASNPIQHKMLWDLEHITGMTDTFNHRHGTTTPYITWSNRITSTSPDHIHISTYQQHMIHTSQVDHTVRNYGLDHSQVTTTFIMHSAIHTPNKHRPPPRFNIKRKQDYANLVEELLPTHTPPDIDTLHTTLTKAHHTLFRRKPHQPTQHKNTRTAYNTLKQHLILQHELLKQRPLKSTHKRLMNTLQIPNSACLTQKIKTLKRRYNKQSLLRRQALIHTAINKRTNNYLDNKIKRFLDSTLHRNSNYSGIQGTCSPQEQGIDTDPQSTKIKATQRIKAQYYEPRIPPQQIPLTQEDPRWDTLPRWFSDIFKTTWDDKPRQDLQDSLNLFTMDELERGLKFLKNNKAGGPSGITGEMYKHLNSTTLQSWVLPLLNKALQDRDLPSTAKAFSIWAIEKTPGEGTILNMEGKINIRPISLFEVFSKLFEILIHKRIQYALHDTLDKNQYGFTKHVGVDDLLLTYNFIMEDAHNNTKEIHISNNDCSQAYDVLAPWVMEIIYKFHRFPPDLTNLLLNLDKNQMGRVITAHGPGDSFPKTCGLGQGSILAPLKWKLFLDPLLRNLQRLPDPYKLNKTISFSGKAFADDLTTIAATHRGYKERMILTNNYLSFFGVELSAPKTTYTYTNSISHHDPIKIWSHNTPENLPTNVASPYTPLRYVGGWLSPAQNWITAQRNFERDIIRPLNVIKYKKLTWAEFRYIINIVINKKALYILQVAYIPHSLLTRIQSIITTKAKHILKLPQTVSSHLIYMPTTQGGMGLQSMSDERDTILINQAHRILNSTTCLGDIARDALTQLRDRLHMTHNPLSTPHLIPKHLQKSHWLARVAHSLTRTNTYLNDTTGSQVIKNKRPHDYPIIDKIPNEHRSEFIPYLKKHNILWLSDISNAKGIAIQNPPNISTTREPQWWIQLKRWLTRGNTTRLTTPISPSPSTNTTHFTKHEFRIGEIVFFPHENELSPGTFLPYPLGSFHKVTNNYRDEHLRDTCVLKELIQDLLQPTQTQTRRTHWPTITQYSALRISNRSSTQWANSLISVPYRVHSVRKTPRAQPRKVYLISTNHQITTKETHITGPTPLDTLQDLPTRIAQRFKIGEDNLIYSDSEEDDRGTCHVCSLPGNLYQCHKATRCNGLHHHNCHSLKHNPRTTSHWICPECTTWNSHQTNHSLTSEELQCIHNTQTQIYTAADGSVKTVDGIKSSTWGLYIDTPRFPITRNGKIRIRPGEESSFRVEMEGLIQLYTHIPPSSTHHIIHACDNTSAIHYHDEIWSTYTPSERKLLNTHYHSTIRRLRLATQHHKTPITIKHTKSHKEHETTEDTDLDHRRQTLAKADILADEAHDQRASPHNPIGDELYTLCSNDEIIQKSVKSTIQSIIADQHHQALIKLEHDGAIQAKHPSLNWKQAIHKLPYHLYLFQHRLRLRRLPTYKERHRRGDKQTDGTHVPPTCPSCTGGNPSDEPIETHEHLFLQCPQRLDINAYLLHTIQTILEKYIHIPTHRYRLQTNMPTNTFENPDCIVDPLVLSFIEHVTDTSVTLTKATALYPLQHTVTDIRQLSDPTINTFH